MTMFFSAFHKISFKVSWYSTRQSATLSQCSHRNSSSLTLRHGGKALKNGTLWISETMPGHSQRGDVPWLKDIPGMTTSMVEEY